MQKIVIASFVVSLLLASQAYSCEPCMEIFDLQKTSQKADLIIIGQKTGEGPRSDFGEGYGGPDWITVKIIKGIKGAVSGEIKVNSWDAMCEYGIAVDDKTYVMFLKKESRHDDHDYDAVNYGCSIKTYPFENNMVIFDGKKITLKSFIKKLGISGK